MVSRKITVDNSVRYVPKSEKKQNQILNQKKAGSLPRKQDKKFSKNILKIVKDFTAGGFGLLKWTMNCYF